MERLGEVHSTAGEDLGLHTAFLVRGPIAAVNCVEQCPVPMLVLEEWLRVKESGGGSDGGVDISLDEVLVVRLRSRDLMVNSVFF